MKDASPFQLPKEWPLELCVELRIPHHEIAVHKDDGTLVAYLENYGTRERPGWLWDGHGPLSGQASRPRVLATALKQIAEAYTAETLGWSSDIPDATRGFVVGALRVLEKVDARLLGWIEGEGIGNPDDADAHDRAQNVLVRARAAGIIA
jgi:hypothetical protein